MGLGAGVRGCYSCSDSAWEASGILCVCMPPFVYEQGLCAARVDVGHATPTSSSPAAAVPRAECVASSPCPLAFLMKEELGEFISNSRLNSFIWRTLPKSIRLSGQPGPLTWLLGLSQPGYPFPEQLGHGSAEASSFLCAPRTPNVTRITMSRWFELLGMTT